MIGYLVMGLLLIIATRPLYAALPAGRATPGVGRATPGIDRATAGMAVMFSLFALKIAGAHLLNERTWHTWERLRATPASFAEILLGKALPLYAAILLQQLLLFAFAAATSGLRPAHGWATLAIVIATWSGCVLLMGTGAATLARTPAQLSATGDIFALLTTILGGALVPTLLLPRWLRTIAPVSPGHWALDAYQAALTGTATQLLHPLIAFATFGTLGVLLTVMISRAQNVTRLCSEERWPPRRN